MKKEEKPNYPLMKIKGKDYLEVKYRVAWFREEHPDWPIETEIVVHTDKMAIMKATVKNASGAIIATAHKTENIAGFSDFLEKAETSSIGRALALLGYGTVNALELEETDRPVDSPVQKLETPLVASAKDVPPCIHCGSVLFYNPDKKEHYCPKYKDKKKHIVGLSDEKLEEYKVYFATNKEKQMGLSMPKI